jgi:hypothetical protein
MFLFQGRRSAFAEQQPNGSYHPVRRELTPEDVQRHLDGDWTIGIYLGREEDSKVRCIVWDIDRDGDMRQANADVFLIRRVLLRAGINSGYFCLEFSGKKGYHAWLFLEEWTDALEARRFGLWVMEQAGITCEVYPKGLVALGGYGTLVKLPLGVHLVTGKRSELVEVDMPEIEAKASLSRKWWQLLVRGLPPEPKPAPVEYEGDGKLLPCAEHIRDHGETRGARNHAMYALALQCRRAGFSEGETDTVLAQANSHLSPSLDEHTLRSKRLSVYRLTTPTFDCRREFLHDGKEPHCQESCPRYRPEFGAARRGDGGRTAPDTRGDVREGNKRGFQERRSFWPRKPARLR